MTGTIVDRFEIKERTALEYGASGVVVMFRHTPSAALPKQGDPILLIRKDGWIYSARAEDVRHEPSGSSSGLFLRNLTSADVPLDSLIRWGDEIAQFHSAVA